MFPVLLAAVTPCLLHAQQPASSPKVQSALLDVGRLVNAPAEFVLLHRKELALTDAQVVSIEKLAAALRDSSSARMAVRTRDAQKAVSGTALASAMEWSGPVDEAAIRDAMRAQSAAQAEIMIASARDRRLVATLLTPAQRAQLPQLQMAEMTKALRDGGR